MATQLAISLFAEIISRYPREQPLPFLTDVLSSSYLALFWDNADTVRLVKFCYLLHGLVTGEHCIYTTDEDTKQLRDQMAKRGLDVDYDEKGKGSLHVLQIDDPMDEPEGLTNGVGKVVKTIFANTRPPYSTVCQCTRDVYTNGGKVANMEVEARCHKCYLGKLPLENPYSMFKNFPGSMICYSPVDKFNAKTHSDWIMNHLGAHHAAIYVPNTHEVNLIRLH